MKPSAPPGAPAAHAVPPATAAAPPAAATQFPKPTQPGASVPAAPPAPAAPSAPSKVASPRKTIPPIVRLSLTTGPTAAANRIVIYGTGGIGKTTLAAYLPGAAFLDVEGSTRKFNVARDVAGDWLTLRGKIAGIEAAPPEGLQTLIIDTATVAEEMAKEHVIATRKTEKGNQVDAIEGFGWNKGWDFVFDEFNALLADLDRLVDNCGINVCLTAHDVTSPVPNPGGEEFLRWEPRLYGGDKKGKSSVRDRVKNWADFVLFIRYDVFVKDGKGQGSGTRTIYTEELPTHVAKTRGPKIQMPFDLRDPAAAWRALEILKG